MSGPVPDVVPDVFSGATAGSTAGGTAHLRSIAVEMVGITKRYGSVFANRNAALSVYAGEVHAIVGENGAGKSTLMKILYGLVHPEAGTIEVRGKRLKDHSPRDAIDRGVGMVFQHFMLVPTLTVFENVVLGLEPRRRVIELDRARARALVQDLSDRHGLAIDPERRVEDCPVGIQQRVEILKVLFRGADVIILDEPTAVLTPQEVHGLVSVMRELANKGSTILLVTHKLREVMAAADRVTIMRQGTSIRTLETRRTSPEEIAEEMVGRAMRPPKRQAQIAKDIVLDVQGLVPSDHGPLIPRRVLRSREPLAFHIRAGEILGVAGIAGNGQTELVECLAGLRPSSSGRVLLFGRDITALSPRERIEAGLGHIPEDRHKRGVVLDFTVEENTILGRQRRFSSGFSMSFAAIRSHAIALIQISDVRPPDPSLRLRALSGGNQQKVVLGRELSSKPSLLLAAHPTRGLDVQAIEFIEKRLLEARTNGAAILLVSSELSELLTLSDRMIVMFDGAIAGEVDPANIDERTLGVMMSGEA